MNEDVKSSMAADAEKAKRDKLLKLLAPLKMDGQETANLVDALISKYGGNAYDLAVNLMVRPYEVMPIITKDKTAYSSKAALKFVKDNTISVENLAKMLKKDTKEIEAVQPKAQPAKTKNNNLDRQILREALSRAANDTKKRQQEVRPDAISVQLPQLYLQRQRRFEAAVNASTPKNQNKRTTVATNLIRGGSQLWGKKQSTWNPQEIIHKNDSAEDIYARVSGVNQEQISIDRLMQETGVKGADFQQLINQSRNLEGKAEIINAIIPGKRNKALAAAADKTQGICRGDCLTGVQGMFVPSIYTDANSPISAINPSWSSYTPKGKKNEASDARHLLDDSGDFLTVSVRNEAYGEPRNSLGNRHMKEFNKALPAGTVASTGRCSEGSRGNNNVGSKAGHIWVKDNKGRSCSDGVQPNGPADFNAYGEYMYVSLSRDASVPKELALRLIKIAQTRQAMEERLAMANRDQVVRG